MIPNTCTNAGYNVSNPIPDSSDTVPLETSVLLVLLNPLNDEGFIVDTTAFAKNYLSSITRGSS